MRKIIDFQDHEFLDDCFKAEKKIVIREIAETNSLLQEFANVGIKKDFDVVKACIGLSDEAFCEIADNLKAEYIAKLEPICEGERVRINQSYEEMKAKALPYIHSLQWRVKSYGYIWKPSAARIIEVDELATLNALHKKNEKKYDSAKIRAYYDKILEVKKSMDALNEWEIANNTTGSFLNEAVTYKTESDKVKDIEDEWEDKPFEGHTLKSMEFLKNPDKEVFYEAVKDWFAVD